MARLLVVVPPLSGHIYPTASLAEALAERGHEVSWAASRTILTKHIDVNGKCFDLPIIDPEREQSRSHVVRGLASVKFFYEQFLFPMTRLCFSPLEIIANDYKPDLIICDHQMVAGALVARKLGIPWVSTMTTTASILNFNGPIEAWIEQHMREMQTLFHLPQRVPRPDFSPYACLVFSSQALIGEQADYLPAPYHFIGPAMGNSRVDVPFPWDRLSSSKRKVLVSLGTVSQDRSERFYRVMAAGLADCDIQVILVASQTLDITWPENFIVQQFVPQLRLLPQMHAVVSHAGHNTVCETLSLGKPMVLAPIRDDQPVIAHQVCKAGAGRTLRFGKFSANEARRAVEDVLDDPRYTENARRLQVSLQALNGPRQGTGIVESLLARSGGGEAQSSRLCQS